MDKVIYLIVITFLFSCKTNTVAQEKESIDVKNAEPKIETLKAEKPVHPGIQDQMSPGTIHLEGVVLSVSENKSICGKSYRAAVNIKVGHIKGSGSGIVNMIASGQEVTFGVRKYMAADLTSLKQELTAGKRFFFIVEEGRCRDGSEAVYLISSFKGK